MVNPVAYELPELNGSCIEFYPPELPGKHASKPTLLLAEIPHMPFLSFQQRKVIPPLSAQDNSACVLSTRSKDVLYDHEQTSYK